MKLRVTVAAGNIKVDEVVEGADAEAVVSRIQERVAREAGFLAGTFIRRMTPLQFAQEATKRYNAASGDDAPAPATCDDFIRLGVAKGFATPLPDA